MKKFATLIASSALAVTGLAVAPTAPASADPYPQSVATSCAAATNTPVPKGNPVRVRVSWTSAGNAKVRGTVMVKLIRRKTGEVVRGATKEYYGKPRKFTFNRVRPGAYRVRVTGVTPPASVFKGCSARAFVRVKRS